MGLLKDGKTYQWHESIPHVQYVKEHGILQFINIYNKVKDRVDEELKWGDEVEYMLVKRDESNKRVMLSLKAWDILLKLHKQEEEYEHQLKEGKTPTAPTVSWRPEYGRYMIEGTPFFPYDVSFKALTQVEANMQARRKEVTNELAPGESILSLTAFPLLGVGQFTEPWDTESKNEITQSIFIPDSVINPHIRFATLTRNIRERREGKVCILAPLYLDKNTDVTEGRKSRANSLPKQATPLPIDVDIKMAHSSPTQYLRNPYAESNPCSHKPCISKTPSIYMDAMAFGMGNCCLQVTFLARDVLEARYLYDQFAVLCPIMLATSAATPILRGLLADTDVRWNTVSASVDDRTPQEKIEISKSRYDSISTYIGTSPEAQQYSDLKIKVDQKSYETLIKAGVDPVLAKHVAHLFIRDPLVVYEDAHSVNDEQATEHFENIQSSNWQTVRFKPPPPNSSIGWRVEFRVLEAQLSDFENAAYAVFIALVTRVIIAFNLNLYMPISQVDENMARAHKRGAVTKEKFHFRTNILGHQMNGTSNGVSHNTNSEAHIVELTADEIINGSETQGFVGFIPLIRKYLDKMQVEPEIRKQLERYITLVSKRASGELKTTATFIREFVTSHPSYKQDSVVLEEIAYDLICSVEKISDGRLKPTELIGAN